MTTTFEKFYRQLYKTFEYGMSLTVSIGEYELAKDSGAYAGLERCHFTCTIKPEAVSLTDGELYVEYDNGSLSICDIERFNITLTDETEAEECYLLHEKDSTYYYSFCF